MTGTFKSSRVEIKGDGIPNWTQLCETGDIVIADERSQTGGRIDVRAYDAGYRDECIVPNFCVSARFNPATAALEEFRKGMEEYRQAVIAAMTQVYDWIERHSEGLGHA